MTDDTHEVQGEAESKASYPRSARIAAPTRRCSTRYQCRGFSTLGPTGLACQQVSTLQPSAEVTHTRPSGGSTRSSSKTPAS
jgi:hypothetical protein